MLIKCYYVVAQLSDPGALNTQTQDGASPYAGTI